MKKVIIFNIFLLLFFTACSKGVSLEGLSATSVKKSYIEYGPEKVLDGDRSTCWYTMPGAGPEEGLMFHFEKAMKISYIEIIPAGQGNKVKSVELYVNGMDLGEKNLHNNKDNRIEIKSNVKSLYLKIRNIEGLRQTPGGTEYVSADSAGISEVKFFDKDEKELKLAAPIVKKGKILASSTLSPEEAYNTDLLFDSRKNFGWTDGNEKKVGDGEYLKILFDEEVTIKKIKIWNGYQRSIKHYEKNEAVDTFSFSADGKSAQYTLSDKMEPQVVDLKEPLTAKEFTLKIIKSRKGTRYKDLVISEMRFFDGDNWFIVNSGGLEKRKEQLVARIKNTILEKIVNKMKNYRFSHGSALNITQSIILRPNSSFVIYRTTVNNDDIVNIVADGNWQIISNSADKAIIKIFGKINIIASMWQTIEKESYYDPYSGEAEEEGYRQNIKLNSTNLFHDFLEISNDQIISKKGHFTNMYLTL